MNANLLRRALFRIETRGLGVVRLSGFYRTPCVPAGAGPDYVNAAAVLATRLSPGAVLARLHRVETAMGRVRAGRWGQRVIDLDLLACGGRILPDARGLRHWIDLPPDQQARLVPGRLILPHPRLQDRGFVLRPLADIAPGWRHPLLGRSVVQMLAALPAAQKSQITRFYG